MRANARIVAAEGVAEMAVPIHVIGLDAETAIGIAPRHRRERTRWTSDNDRLRATDRRRRNARASITNSFARSRASAVLRLTLALSHRPHLALYNAVPSPKFSPISVPRR